MADLSWRERMAGWSAEWKTGWAEAQRRFAGWVGENPQEAAKKAEVTLAAFKAWRAELDALRARYPQLTPEQAKAFQRSANAYHTALAGILADTGRAELGILPIVVLGIALSVAGTAWAVSLAPWAQSRLEEARVLRLQVEEDIRRTPAGQPLPDRHLPPSGGKGGGIKGGVLVAGVGLLAAGLAVLWARSSG